VYVVKKTVRVCVRDIENESARECVCVSGRAKRKRSVRVCVCLSLNERELVTVFTCMRACVIVCVCVRERERERGNKRHCVTQRKRGLRVFEEENESVREKEEKV